MRASALRWLAAGAAGCLASCAFITVNVYFPEKEVKKAFKALDEKYLKPAEEPQQGETSEPADGLPPASPPAPGQAPELPQGGK
ncbi:hypothetical protein [Geobacter sp.]|uniref:hypothetical protein n=1 Tax=Geobacter sp. TaxID=46610 RepID=UPI002635121C|nr:hypothetical protein [Geobacter sp.]